MHVGHYISGVGHLGLIGWLLLGGLFAAEPEPIEITEVSMISGADFDALIEAQEPPQSVTEVAQPAAPETRVEEPEVVSIPVEEPAPDVTELEAPPEPDVDELPTDLSEDVGDVAVLAPEVAPEAAPRPIERVAPEPVAQPDPQSVPDVVEQEAVTPDDAGEAPEQEQQEATAPEEAVSEIVTEATSAPAASSRPPGRRPAAPTRQAAAEVETETPATDPVNNDDVLAALNEAQEPVAAPSGPPLSSGEKEALRVAVSQCWNIGSLSSEALGTTVVVEVRMTQDAKPVNESIRMIGASGGSDAAARRVFDSARRAIILCGARGLNLPQEKFSQWQNIEMTFDPRKMALR